ncbi:hypothetical protein CC85DRAFT_307645 [Cutaneotrichosporon oleaginosum]|uniref:PSI domain-containing protein n=1 Tax=Cutaneotrichosporon oleaginosum TaxID=879819 RepID=A0A0J0XQ81_9TREE|nr:uncharacterized protein CC85DRAFT_307645 [Cutaneotrichosporon oleaginosum]KLT43276.1 hypothetical protein CC85DRAFT_307645 [Cutaneotrichosporon oleaginosum]TXT14461.1 hypothetical protein COLE_00654 [Cutaneotrichosporon oleaginosum]
MHLRRTRLVFIFVALALLALVSASPPHQPASPLAPRKKPYVAQPAEGYECTPFGVCEACPEDERHQPFCQPFGNRRLLHCKKAGGEDKGVTPAWEACGKVIKKEQRDFYEFVTANVLLLMVCLTIFAVRTSALATQQYRQLAARIGIPSGAWRT